MPRIPRQFLEGHFFHIMTKGISNEFLFRTDKNKRLYLKYFYENIDWDCTTVLAYVVMENHFHMLMYTKALMNFSATMKKVNTRFAQYYNRSKERKGYVFQDRFVSQPIINRTHLLNCLTYIHKNPVKAKMVAHESEYEYSSYWEYLDEKYLISNESALMLFGTCDKTKYFNLYLKMHNKNYGYAFFEEDEEIDYKGLINELRQKDINEKNIVKLLHYVYKLPIFKLMKLTGNSKLFVHTAIREGPINKL